MAITFTQLAAASADTSNTTSYAGNAGTPAAGDLLICGVVATATIIAGTMSGGGWTWTNLVSLGWNTGASPSGILNVFWASATAATSTTPTWDCTGDAATGAAIYCMRITGSEGQKVPAVRQISTTTNNSANPSAAFASNPVAANAIIAFACNGTNSATQWTPPSSGGGWTEQAEVTFASPACSLECATISNGSETSKSPQWTNANTSQLAIVAIELWVPHTRSTGGGMADSSPMNY